MCIRDRHKALTGHHEAMKANQENELLKEKVSVLEFMKKKQDEEIVRLKNKVDKPLESSAEIN